MLEKYNHYTIADFLDDADFIGYIKYSRSEAEWTRWLNSNPPSRNAFEEASVYLRTVLNATRIPVPEGAVESTLEQIRFGIGQRAKVRRMRRNIWVSVSAAACLLAAIVAGRYYYNSKITITTDYAQQKTVLLPDSSVVILNAHSSLSYYRAWQWRHERKVWLTGEGLFKVTHLNRDTADIRPGERFTACVDNLSVQVLGTTFNIKQRRREIAISLISGKIAVTDLERKEKGALILHTGESVRYKDSLLQIVGIQQLSNQPQAWVDHKIKANGMTVQDIIDACEDMYGEQIILGNPAQAGKRIDGTISLENDADVLYMLANILNADVVRKGKTIYLEPK